MQQLRAIFQYYNLFDATVSMSVKLESHEAVLRKGAKKGGKVLHHPLRAPVKNSGLEESP